MKMSKKTKIITAAILGIILVFAVMILFYPKSNYSASINRVVTIKNGVAETESFGTVLTVKSKGKYTIVADWWKGEEQTYDVPNFVTGLIITSESGEFRYPLTASSLHIDTHPMELEPGRYKITFYVLTSQKGYDDFCTSNFDDYDHSLSPEESFFADGTWDMHYSVKFEADNSLFVITCLLGGITIGLLFVIIIATLAVKHDAPVKKYDERQISMQGKAYKYGFFTMLIYFCVLSVVSILNALPNIPALPFGADILALLGVLAGCVVFAVTAVIHDAYFRIDESRSFIVTFLVVLSLINIAIGVFHIVNGDQVKDGIINMRNSGNLLCGVALLILPTTILVKKILDRNEE